MRRTLWVFGHEAARLAHHAVDGRRGPGPAAPGARDARRRGHRRVRRSGWRRRPRRSSRSWRRRGRSGPGDRRCGCPRSPCRCAVGSGSSATTHRRPLAGAAHARVRRPGACGPGPTGTWINGQYRWAATSAWWPGGFGARPSPRGPRRSWRAGGSPRSGPAPAPTCAWWAGWTVATTKRALADVGAVEVELDEGPGYVLPDDVDPVAAAPPSAVLLPGLDPSTMGWKQRAFHLDGRATSAAVRPQRQRRPHRVGRRADRRRLAPARRRRDRAAPHVRRRRRGPRRPGARAAELAALLGDVRFRVRFPAPLQAKLA